MRNILNTYMDILKISSPPGKEKNLSNYIKARLIARGIPPEKITEDHAGNLIFKVESGFSDNPYPRIVFTAHMDNFIKKHEVMTPYLDEGCIKNRNSSVLGGDDKTAVAAFLELAFFINREYSAKKKIHCDLTVIFTAHEENLTWRGWSWGASELDAEYLKNTDLIIAMDVPSGKKIMEDHFFIYHMEEGDPLIQKTLDCAAILNLPDIYYESEKEGFIGGDATTFYRKNKKKVIDFATGNFLEHTRAEFTDLRIYLTQALWILNFFNYLSDNSGLKASDVSELFTDGDFHYEKYIQSH